MDTIERLIASNNPFLLTIFVGCVYYVFKDITSKSSKMDTLIDSVTSISQSLLVLASEFKKDKENLEKAEVNIKELQNKDGEISHRLVKVETRLEDIQKGEQQ